MAAQQVEKKVVYRAGLIPYVIEDNNIKMMFMVPSNAEYGGTVPQLAKGKVDPGEDTRAAAIREAKEELGLFYGNLLFLEELGTFLGRTTVYVGKIKDKNMFGEPSFETSKVLWLTLEEFLNQGRDLHKPIVKAAQRFIMKKEGIE